MPRALGPDPERQRSVAVGAEDPAPERLVTRDELLECLALVPAGYRWTAEVGVYVRPGAQGSGVGSALYTQLLPLCRDRGLHTLVAGIALPNEPSVRLHERFGFSPAGVLPFVGYKQGRWIDVGYWVLHFPGTPERVS